MTIYDTVRLALWVFSPVLVLGGAWAMVALVQRWLAVRRVRQCQRQLLDRRMGNKS